MAETYFLSCVTNELEYVRKELWLRLSRYGIEVTSQDYGGLPSDPNALDLVSRLRTLVLSADCRVFLIGFSSGWCPTFGVDNLRLCKVDGIDKLSATQLEFLFSVDPSTGKQSLKSYVFFLENDIIGLGLDRNQERFREWIKANHLETIDSVSHPLEVISRIERSMSFRELYGNKVKFVSNLPAIDRENECYGRDDIRMSLYESWCQFRVAPLKKEVHRRILHGPSGIGKTHVAVDFGTQAKDHFKCAFIVTGNTREALRSAFADLVVFTGVKTPSDEYSKIDTVQKYLNESEEWLLIMDNIDTPELWESMRKLTENLIGGFLLVTSRMDYGPIPERILVKPLERQAAIEFVQATTGTNRAFAECLNDFPDSICTRPVFLRILRRHLELDLTRFESLNAVLYEAQHTRVEHGVVSSETDLGTVFLGQVLCSLTRHSMAELIFLCLLARHEIPLSIHQSVCESTIPRIISELGKNPSVPKTNGVANLLDYPLVRFDPDKISISIHSVIAEAVLMHIPDSMQAVLREFVAGELLRFLIQSGVSDRPNEASLSALSYLVPHLRFFADFGGKNSTGCAQFLVTAEYAKHIPNSERLEEEYWRIKATIEKNPDLSIADCRRMWDEYKEALDTWSKNYENSIEIAQNLPRDPDIRNQISDKFDRVWNEYVTLRINTFLEICDCLLFEEMFFKLKLCVLEAFSFIGFVDLESLLQESVNLKSNVIDFSDLLMARSEVSNVQEQISRLSDTAVSKELLKYLMDAYSRLDQFELARACKAIIEAN